VAVVAHDCEHVAAGEREHPRHELAEPARADEQHAVRRAQVDLLRDLERGGEWLAEHGGLVGHGVGHAVEVGDGDRDQVGEGAVAADDADHRARRAVAAQAGAARRAGAAGRVDLGHDPRADPLRAPSAETTVPHELVAGDAREGGVAA